MRRGIELRNRGDNEAALGEFGRAYELARSPVSAAQLGLVEQALGNWLEAERHLDEAMRASGDAWVARNRAALERAVVVIRQHLGTLQIRTSDEGDEVRIDGTVVGTTPLAAPLRVRAGEVTLEVRRNGFYPVSRRVTIAADSTSLEDVALQPLPPAEASPAPAPSERPMVVAPSAASAPPPTPPPRRAVSPPGAFRLATAVASVALTAFVIALGVRENAVTQYFAMCPIDGPLSTNCESIHSVDIPAAATEIVAASVGVLAVGAATILYLRGRSSASRSHASLSCGPTGPFALGCSATF
jgi:hypothetical protein